MRTLEWFIATHLAPNNNEKTISFRFARELNDRQIINYYEHQNWNEKEREREKKKTKQNNFSVMNSIARNISIGKMWK